MKKVPLFLLAGMTLLFSCSKNDDNATDPTQEAAAKLQKDIQGKWLFSTDIVIGRKAIRAVNYTNRSMFGRPTHEEVTVNSVNGTTSSMPGFIEFNSDSTYIIFDENGQVYTGKFESKTGDSIVLSGIGSLSGISISGSTLNFKLFYQKDNKTITITSNKAPEVPASDRTTLLCQHAWYIADEASGADWIGETGVEFDEQGNETVYTIDSVGFIMSKSGTYLVQEFGSGKLRAARMANWKWHSTKADYIAYSWEDGVFDEENHRAQIAELTATKLKIVEGYDEDGDGIDDEVDTWILKPAGSK